MEFRGLVGYQFFVFVGFDDVYLEIVQSIYIEVSKCFDNFVCVYYIVMFDYILGC